MWPWVRSAVSAGLAMIRPHPKAEGKPSLPWYLTICVDFFSHEGRNFGAMCDWYLVFLSIQKPMAMQTLHTVWGPRCYHFDWWGTSVKCSSLEELPGKVGYHLLLKFGYVPREQLKSQGGQETYQGQQWPGRKSEHQQDLLQYLNIPLRGLAEFLRWLCSENYQWQPAHLFREEGVDFPKSLQWTWHGQDQGGGKVETGHAYQYSSSSAGRRHSPGLESDFFKTNEKVMDIDNTVWELMGVAVLQVQVKPKFCLGLFLVWSWSTVGLANAWSLWHMYKVRLGEIRLG